MKKVALLVAAAAIATSTAYAAPIKKSSATVKKAAAATKTTAAKATVIKEEQQKKQAKKAKASTLAPMAAAAQKEVPPQVEPATKPSTGGQSATPAANAKPAALQKRFSGLLYDRASVGMNSANRQQESNLEDGNTVGGEMLVRIGYKVTDTTSISLGTDIVHSYGSDDAATGTSKATWTVYDIYLMAAKSDLGTLPGDVKTKGYLRFYLPTSEGSQESGQIGRLRGQLKLSKAIGKFTAAYIAEPNYFIQDSADYRAAKTDYKSPNGVTATRAFKFTHYAQLGFDATSKLSFYTLLGVDHSWFNKPTEPTNIVEKNAKETEILIAETGAGYSLTDNFALGTGITQYSPDLLAQKANQEGPLYRDELTSYFLEGTLTF